MMNKKQWTAVIKAYIWSIVNSATNFAEDDIDILGELCTERKYASEATTGTEKKPIKKTETEYNNEYEEV